MLTVTVEHSLHLRTVSVTESPACASLCVSLSKKTLFAKCAILTPHSFHLNHASNFGSIAQLWLRLLRLCPLTGLNTLVPESCLITGPCWRVCRYEDDKDHDKALEVYKLSLSFLPENKEALRSIRFLKAMKVGQIQPEVSSR